MADAGRGGCCRDHAFMGAHSRESTRVDAGPAHRGAPVQSQGAEVERHACWVENGVLILEPPFDANAEQDAATAPRWCVFGSDSRLEGRFSLFDCETLEDAAATLSAILARPITLEPGQDFYFLEGRTQ